MDKYLETYKLPILTQGETENLNGPIISEEINLVIKKLPTKKSSELIASLEIYQMRKEELIPIPLKPS